MKYCPIISWRTFIIIYVICLQISCAKDADLLSEYVINETIAVEEGINFESAIKIPIDFDWSNIPDEYENQVLEINGAFDLKGQNIVLPVNVTLYFNEGHFENGTIEGDETFIYSDTGEPIVTDASFTGTYENEYVKPHWFGAVMDGVTDDRESFVKTLAVANNLGKKVLIDRDIFLDVEEIGDKTIIIRDDTWIEGVNNAKIIVNFQYSPAFYMALSKNITFTNIEIQWDQTYDVLHVWTDEEIVANVIGLEKAYLENEKGINFSVGNPVWKGVGIYQSMFLISACEDINFDNVRITAKGLTADSFIPWVVKFKDEYAKNSTVVNENTSLKSVNKNIVFTDIVFDGTIMGIQGVVQNLLIDGFKSYRYTDYQTKDGNFIGGNESTGYFAPPHLFYLNTDGSTQFNCKNNKISNVIDYGEYVGSPEVRSSISGYCNSFKFTDEHENLEVNNYTSYRRDGLGDIENLKNSTFNNIISESQGNIFNPTYGFSALRFVGSLTNVTFTNVLIKDNSDILELYPLGMPKGDFVTMDNVNVYVNEFNAGGSSPFGISGSNNTVTNSSLNIENHTASEDYIGTLITDNNSRETGKNNYYDIVVNGWRNIETNPIKKSIRVLLANKFNSNSNYAKITDTSNNYVIEQVASIKKDFWHRSELVKLGKGKTQELDIYIPTGYKIRAITALTIENLANNIEVSIGTSNSQDNLIKSVSNTAGEVVEILDFNTEIYGYKNIYLNADKDFNNTGKIEVTIELIRETEGE